MALTRLRSPEAAARWLASWVRGALRIDSREVRPGDAFIAWPGYATDGRRHVAQALAAGAATCLVEDEGIDAYGFDDARIATLPGLKAATAPIAAEYYGHPSRRLAVVAVTGTNGKTSTAWWTAQALSRGGRRCGVIGTLGVGEPPDAVVPTGLTTPDPVTLQQSLRRFADDGFAACAIEASSIGLVEHRLDATTIDVALFTNFTRDHLDYHGSMAAYWAAKRSLFHRPGLRAAVVDVDDAAGAGLAAELAARAAAGGAAPALWTVGLGRSALAPRLVGRGLRQLDDGLAFEVCEDGAAAPVQARVVGGYNASNLLVVLGALRSLAVPLADAARLVSALPPVPGRLQRVGAGRPEVVVDYAHTPDALEKALGALRPLAALRGGRLWCVFGCGGNRDATKRPLMGAIAARLADRVVVTSDNPRDEDARSIVQQVLAGTAGSTPVEAVVDRRAAIAQALAAADAADVVLLAGKGHEHYQEIAGVRHPFADAEVAAEALARRAGAAS